MQTLTDMIVTQIINNLDNTPVNPTREELYLSFLLCKNLCDLCETGVAILDDIERRKCPMIDLPNKASVNQCRSVLQSFFSDKMFIDHPEYGSLPNWSFISKFPTDKGHIAFKIYRAIEKNVMLKPKAKGIKNAIFDRNLEWFLENFEAIFEEMPFQDSLANFKNFVGCQYVEKDQRDYVWDFFESLIYIFIDKEDNIAELKTL